MSRAVGFAVAFVVGLMGLLLVGVAGVARAAGPLSWSSAVLVDHRGPFATSGDLEAVSCPSAGLCVAVDDAGGVMASTHPAGAGSSWRVVYSDGVRTVLRISCPSARLCVAVDDGGDVVVSRKPGSGAWSVVRVDRADGLRGVSCASASLCVAFDAKRLFVSTDPTGGASSWRVVRVEPGKQGGVVMAVSCPSRSFCAAVDSAGNVITSTRPTGGRLAWRSVHIDRSTIRPVDFTRVALIAISCPSRGLCVAGDDAGNLFISTHPASGPAGWRSDKLPKQCLVGSCFPVTVTAISCPSLRLCVALGDGENEQEVITSTHPPGGSSWTSAGLPPGIDAVALSCPTTGLCVVARHGPVVGTNANVSTNPTGGASAWRAESIPTAGYDTLQAISCPSRSFCAAVDNAGNVITSSHPATSAQSWRTTHLGTPTSTGAYIFGSNGISCPSASFCAALDHAGDLLTSNRPTGGASAWAVTRLPPMGTSAGSVSCPTASLCVVATGADILTSSHPGAGASAWTVQYSNPDNTPECGKYGPPYSCPGAPILALTCKSAGLCVALDDAGGVLSSTDPTGGSSAWRTGRFGPCVQSCGSAGVACPSVSFCAASNNDGIPAIFVSHNPAGGEWEITPSSVPPHATAPNLSPESCPSARLCVGVNDGGDILASTNPAGRWTTTDVDHRYLFGPINAYLMLTLYFTTGATGVACPSTSRCVAIDQFGNVIIGNSGH